MKPTKAVVEHARCFGGLGQAIIIPFGRASGLADAGRRLLRSLCHVLHGSLSRSPLHIGRIHLYRKYSYTPSPHKVTPTLPRSLRRLARGCWKVFRVYGWKRGGGQGVV